MSINLPDWIEDRRMDPPQGVVGDSWNWYATEPTAAKKWIAYHHSASPTNQDGGIIAQAHVNKGWGGCGYHIIIRHDEHPRGAGIEYVGDLITWRAGIGDRNNGVVHVCMVGNFLTGKPGKRQLELARQLNEYFLAPNMVLPSINYWNQISHHNALAVQPGGATACPGWQAPYFADWWNYLTNKGGFPHHFYAAPSPAPVSEPAAIVTPQPVVIPEPTPESVPETPTPAPIVEKPEWERTWRDEDTHSRKTLVATSVIDVTTGGIKYALPPNFEIKDIVGYFTYQGTEWARTKYSRDKSFWNGVKSADLAPREVKIPVVVKTTEELLGDVFNQVPAQIANLPREVRENVIERFWAFLKDVLGIIIAPLLKLITKKE